MGANARKIRKLPTWETIAVGVLMLLASACGPASQGSATVATPPAGGNQPPPTPAAPAASTAAASAPSGLPGVAKAFTADYADGSGYKVRVTFTLYPMLKGGDPELTSLFPDGPPCDASSTDGVFAGTVQGTNESPGFSLSATIFRGTLSLSDGLSMGVGSDCIGANQQQGETWGPDNTAWMRGPIEFVISNVFSPASPHGDASVVSGNDPYLIVYRTTDPLDQFEVKSTGPGVTGTAGAVNTVLLHLESLMTSGG